MLQQNSNAQKMTFVAAYQEKFQKVLADVQKSSNSLEKFRDFLCNHNKKEEGISFAEIVSSLEPNQKKLLFDVFTKYCHGRIKTVYRSDKLHQDTLYHPFVVWYAGLVSELCVRYKKDVLDMDEGFKSEDLEEQRHTTFTNGTVVDNVVDFETIVAMIFDSIQFDEHDSELVVKPLVAKIVDLALLVCCIQEYFIDSDREDDDELSDQQERQQTALSSMEKNLYLLFDAMMQTAVVKFSMKIFTDKALNGRTLHPLTPSPQAPFSVVDPLDVENEKKRVIEEKKRALKEQEEARKRKRAEQQLKIAEKMVENAKLGLSRAITPAKKKKTYNTKN